MDPIDNETGVVTEQPTWVYPDALEIGQLGTLDITESNERIPLLRKEQTGWRYKRQACVGFSLASCIASTCCLFASVVTPNSVSYGLIGAGLAVGYGVGSATIFRAAVYGRKEVQIEDQIKFDPKIDEPSWYQVNQSSWRTEDFYSI